MKEYALITGASSGIGYEIAKLLAKKGFNLILCSRRKNRLLYLKKYCENYGIDVSVFPTDLSISDNCIKLFNKFKDKNITVVVNSAGFGLYGDFDKIDINNEISLIQLNVTATAILTKLFASSMNKGTILNVCSSAAFCPDPLMASYGASKAYIYSYSKAVNCELKKRNKKVRVLLLCPGAVNTEFDSCAGVNNSLSQISAKKCAKIAINGLFACHEMIIPTLKIKAGYIFSRILPEKFTTLCQYNIQKSKK